MKKARSDYKICPLCGATLDIGEVCDCTDETEAAKRPQERLSRANLYNYAFRYKSPCEGQITA